MGSGELGSPSYSGSRRFILVTEFVRLNSYELVTGLSPAVNFGPIVLSSIMKPPLENED